MTKLPEFIESTHPYCLRPIMARGIYSGTSANLKGRMVRGFPVQDFHTGRIFLCFFSKTGRVLQFPIEPFTLSYATGFKDRNEQIFQGDIVELTLPTGERRRFVAVFCSSIRNLQPLPGFVPGDDWIALHAVGFKWRTHVLFPSTTETGEHIDTHKMKILGNIFQNADLLKDDGSDLPF